MKQIYKKAPRQLSRRRFLQCSGTSLLLPSALASANTSQERKFLFVHCQGGWDQCYFSAPLHGNSNIDMEEDSTEAVLQGIHFVDSAIKENMRGFFDQFGNRCALINGIESRSVAHDVCLRLINTGTSLASTDDWSSILAGNAQEDPIMQPSLKILLRIKKAENLDYPIILIKKLACITENKYLKINNIFNEL